MSDTSKQALASGLPMDAAARKSVPIFSGVLRYFPDALAEVAIVSKAGNDQHNPGQPLHWAKQKSRDEHDALTRHLMDAGTRDIDGTRHSAKVAWRALAALQREIEAERGYGYDAETDTWRHLGGPAEHRSVVQVLREEERKRLEREADRLEQAKADHCPSCDTGIPGGHTCSLKEPITSGGATLTIKDDPYERKTEAHTAIVGGRVHHPRYNYSHERGFPCHVCDART